MRRKSRIELPFGLMRCIAALVLFPMFGFRVQGREHLARCRGPVILAGNHTGYLDSLAVLVSCSRYFRFLMTEEVFGWGLIGKVVRYANIIPLYRGREKRGLLESIQLLCRGGALCIFPEGKLTQDGELSPFKAGVAFLHEKSGAPIVPFWIEGGFEAWPQKRGWPVFRPVVLQFGAPIEARPGATRASVIYTFEQRMVALKDHFLNPPQPQPAMPVMMGAEVSDASACCEGPSCRFPT